MRAFLLSILAAVALAAVYFLVSGDSSSQAGSQSGRPAAGAPRVVLFVGDGMGVATVTAARIERGMSSGLSHPSDGRLRIDEAGAVALVRTHSADHLVTDSAASATALLTGQRVPNGVISLGRPVARSGGAISLGPVAGDSDPMKKTARGNPDVASGTTRTDQGRGSSGSGPGGGPTEKGEPDPTGGDTDMHPQAAMSGTVGDTLLTLFEIAKSRGLGTGIVTTTRITHATPACGYAHVPSRNQENEIGAALVPGLGNPRLGDGIDVILGGGSSHFLPKRPGTSGLREDGRDLLSELAGKGYQVARNRSELRVALEMGAHKLFGAFSPSHMTYSVDRARVSPDEPSLVEMVTAAISILERDPNGFFLLVEGGRIDHAHHATNGRRAVRETLEFDDAIGWAVERLGSAALILVTADHDHTMVLAGYAEAHKGLYSQAGTDLDGTPYSTILYANGPGGEVPRELLPETLADPDFRERAGVPLASETHGGTDVPLYLFGPEDQIAAVRGTIDNTEVFYLMRDALVSSP